MLKAHLFEGDDGLFIAEIKRAASYLEYGTGGSTLFAAAAGISRIVSVDSDLAWTEKLRAQLPKNRDISLMQEWGVPTDYLKDSKLAELF